MLDGGHANVATIPAPVGGWNVRDALADMPESHATTLDNWFPREGRVDMRPGYSSYATGLGGDVETLAEYISGSARKFLGCANGNIWDITTSTPSSLASSLTNNRWDTANMDGKMGLVNGADAPKQYDGSTVSNMTISGSGLTVANLIGIHVHQGRSYFWEDDVQDFWYSATNTLGGALTKFQLSRVGNFGGKLIAMGTWTHDGGAGADDYAVFLMSSGDVIVYQGTNPADFLLVGVFRLGAPVSSRALIKAGGDLILVTADGYISMQGAISQGRITDRGIISDQINPAVADAVDSFGSNFGWQAFHYPRANMLIFNIPKSTNGVYEQHVFNTNTGAPCRFKDINARCWGIYNDNAYFGGNGEVFLFDDTNEDDGAVINADAFTAPTWLGNKAQQKQVTAVQTMMAANTDIPLSIAIGADFKSVDVSYNTTVNELTGASWDTATWDVSDWAGEGFNTYSKWVNKGAFGYNFRARVKARGNAQQTRWYSVGYMYKPGGLI